MRGDVISNQPDAPGATVSDWPEPTTPAGWALVELQRPALNRHDEMSLRDPASLAGPSVLGSDGAGVLAGVGEGMTGLHIILGTPTQGTHAEMAVVPAANLFPRPSRLTWDGRWSCTTTVPNSRGRAAHAAAPSMTPPVERVTCAVGCALQEDRRG